MPDGRDTPGSTVFPGRTHQRPCGSGAANRVAFTPVPAARVTADARHRGCTGLVSSAAAGFPPMRAYFRDGSEETASGTKAGDGRRGRFPALCPMERRGGDGILPVNSGEDFHNHFTAHRRSFRGISRRMHFRWQKDHKPSAFKHKGKPR